MAQWIRRLPTEQEILGSSPGKVKTFFYFLNDQIGSDKQKHSRLALSTIKIDTQVRLVDGQSSNITRSLFFALKRIKHFFQWSDESIYENLKNELLTETYVLLHI